MKIKSTCALLLSLFSISAFSGQDRGGGSMVNINGTWTLSDYFGPYRTTGELYKLTGEPKAAMQEIIEKLSKYNKEEKAGLTLSAMDKFFIDNAEYRFVKELQCEKSNVDVQYGCTQNGVTYLIEKLFKKLSNEDRILALFHERLHTLKLDHSEIQPYIYAAKKIITGTLDDNSKSDEKLVMTVEDVQKKICKQEYARGCSGILNFGEFWEDMQFNFVPRTDSDLSMDMDIGTKFVFLKDVNLDSRRIQLTPKCSLFYSGEITGQKVIKKGRVLTVNNKEATYFGRYYKEIIYFENSNIDISCDLYLERISMNEFLKETLEIMKPVGIPSSPTEI
jgi:hypothetical protein